MKFFSLIIIGLFLKLSAIAQFTLSCDSFCVLDIKMDSIQTGVMNVTIYNGNTGSINYPTVQVIDNITGDTIGNAAGIFYLYAQPGLDTVTHQLASTVNSLPEPLDVTVLFTDQIWDTTCVLSYPCALATGVSEIEYPSLKVFPNPVSSVLNIVGSDLESYCLLNVLGVTVLQEVVSGDQNIKADVSHLTAGIYFLVVANTNGKLEKQVIVVK